MRSASVTYERHHWHHTTSKPDSSSGERGLWPTRTRKVAVCEGCAGSQACKVPWRKVTLLEISAMPFHFRFCKGNLLSFLEGAWAAPTHMNCPPFKLRVTVGADGILQICEF